MYLRNNLVYNNIVYFLMYMRLLMGQLADYLEETFGFMKDYEARELISENSRSHRLATLKLYDKMIKISEILRRKKMDYIEATKIARTGTKMRRKCWLKGGDQAWRCDRPYMWWDKDHKVMLAGGAYPPMDKMRDGKGQEKYLNTDGYIYVTESDDVQAQDWEKAGAC